MRITENYDVLNERYRTDDLLLLHSDLIEKELDKIEKKCPVKIIEKDGVKYNILIPNKGIENLRYTEKLKVAIPLNMIMPICGLEGRYYLKKITPTHVDLRRGLTVDGMYEIVDKNTGVSLYCGSNLDCLNKIYASLDEFIITKNMIIPWNDRCKIYSSGYLTLEFKNYSGGTASFKRATYDTDGNLVNVDYCDGDAEEIAENAPEIDIPELPVNVELFEQMIIESLKDREELQGCDADNLIDIVNFLDANNIYLAIDLDSLAVYKVNYKKYFNKLGKQTENNGISFTKKSSANKN